MAVSESHRADQNGVVDERLVNLKACGLLSSVLTSDRETARTLGPYFMRECRVSRDTREARVSVGQRET